MGPLNTNCLFPNRSDFPWTWKTWFSDLVQQKSTFGPEVRLPLFLTAYLWMHVWTRKWKSFAKNYVLIIFIRQMVRWKCTARVNNILYEVKSTSIQVVILSGILERTFRVTYSLFRAITVLFWPKLKNVRVPNSNLSLSQTQTCLEFKSVPLSTEIQICPFSNRDSNLSQTQNQNCP